MAENTQQLLDIIAKQKQQIAALNKKLRETQRKAAMTALYLETILEKSPEHLYWLDMESRVVMCNEQQARTYTLSSAKELIGMGIPEIAELLGWDETIANQLRQNDLEVLTQKREITVEESILIKGQERVFQSSKRPFYDKLGNVIGIFGISVDITERKKLERELQKAKEQANTERMYLDNILTSVPEHLYWMDKNEVILGCNDRQAQSFGYKDKSEVIGKSIKELGKNIGWDKHMTSAIHQNNLEIMQSQQSKIIEESSLYNGKYKTFLSYKNPLLNENGEVIGVLGIAVDISKRKKLEHELRQAKEQISIERNNFSVYLDNILANVPEHLYWLDKNEVILGCNDKQARSLGFKNKSEIIGKSLQQIGQMVAWSQPMINDLHKNNQLIMQTGKGVIVEEDSIYEGEYKTLLSYKNPLIDKSGQIIGVLGITIDITERKRLECDLIAAKEQAEAANQAKTEFLMNMSHDLRTPLNGILGISQILYMNEQDETQKSYLYDILSSAGRLLALLNEIIDFSYIEQGTPLKLGRFSIHEVVQETTELLMAEIKEKNLALRVEIETNVPSIIQSDKMRINRILINLLGNAVKFTPTGEIALIIATVEDNAKASWLMIQVKDTGIGMPEDKLSEIFDKFSRLTSSYRGIYKGTGLGLYIVKKFVAELGGSINVESKLEQGSTFTCLLPYVN